ncbi:hypothetical protein Tco_0657644 [Tanacetum coccineum]
MAYVNANCQKFNAVYKRAKRLGKSGENDVDFLKQAQSIYRDEHKGVSFSQEDAWAILRFHPKWDATEQVDLTGNVPEASQEDLFGHDARPRPASKPLPAKKTKLLKFRSVWMHPRYDPPMYIDYVVMWRYLLGVKQEAGK